MVLANPPKPSGARSVTGGGQAIRRLYAACCWAYLLTALGVWFVLCWADRWWPATLVMFAPRWPLALPLAVLVPVELLRRTRCLRLLVLTALVVAGPVMGFCLPWRQLFSSVSQGTPFRVLTCNMHFSSAAPVLLDKLIAAHDPDVVAVQEWPGSTRSALQNQPGWHIHTGPRLFLASRHPIRNVVELGQASMGEHAVATRYDLETSLGVIHLFSVHLATARDGLSETVHEGIEGSTEIQANSARRWEQSAFLAAQAAEVSGPVLLVGDFNTPPQSTIFTHVWKGFRDAFASAGTGWGYTFFAARTMVRIDHILLGKDWSCWGCQVSPYVGSPHRAIIADLVWIKE